jgi:hypothetical protein
MRRSTPVQEKTLATMKDTVREQYEQEQEAKRMKAVEPPTPQKSASRKNPIRKDNI